MGERAWVVLHDVHEHCYSEARTDHADALRPRSETSAHVPEKYVAFHAVFSQAVQLLFEILSLLKNLYGDNAINCASQKREHRTLVKHVHFLRVEDNALAVVVPPGKNAHLNEDDDQEIG